MRYIFKLTYTDSFGNERSDTRSLLAPAINALHGKANGRLEMVTISSDGIKIEALDLNALQNAECIYDLLPQLSEVA